MESLIWQIATPICGGTGFGMRYLWERYTDSRRKSLQLAIDETKFRLEQFYVPIYFLLKREKHIWAHFTDNKRLAGEEFEKYDKKNLEILIKIQGIIKKNLVKARPCEEMSRLIVRFDEHVTVYRVMREMNPHDKKFPRSLGVPYPPEFQSRINAKVEELGMRLNSLMEKLE
jgi:hypothetical protein